MPSKSENFQSINQESTIIRFFFKKEEVESIGFKGNS